MGTDKSGWFPGSLISRIFTYYFVLSCFTFVWRYLKHMEGHCIAPFSFLSGVFKITEPIILNAFKGSLIGNEKLNEWHFFASASRRQRAKLQRNLYQHSSGSSRTISAHLPALFAHQSFVFQGDGDLESAWNGLDGWTCILAATVSPHALHCWRKMPKECIFSGWHEHFSCIQKGVTL